MKKLKIKDLKVNSFVTSKEAMNPQTVKGGAKLSIIDYSAFPICMPDTYHECSRGCNMQ